MYENAGTLNRGGRTHSFKVFSDAQLESELNSGAKLKNIILVALRFFELVHPGRLKRTNEQTITFSRKVAANIAPKWARPALMNCIFRLNGSPTMIEFYRGVMR